MAKLINTGDDKLDKAIAIGGTIAVLYLGNKIVTGVSQIFTPGGKKDNEDNKIVQDTPVETKKLQFLPAVYKRIADQQFNAMNLPGTDEATLFNTLKGLNDEDLKQVYKEFGRRSPSTNVTNWDWLDEFGKPSDLINWYREELNSSELERMRKIWVNTKLWN